MEITEIGQLLLQFLDVYGVPGAIIIVLSILVIKFASKFLDYVAKNAANGKMHLPSSARKIRKDSVFKVGRILTELMQKTWADRVALFEYHNGGYNLTGMPFLHFSLAAARNNLGVDDLSKDFDDILVSSVPDFIREIDINDIYHVKDIKDLEATFPRLYRELHEDELTEAVFCSIEGVDDEVGFLMLAFKNPIGVRQRKVQKELFKKVQKISALLDLKNRNNGFKL